MRKCVVLCLILLGAAALSQSATAVSGSVQPRSQLAAVILDAQSVEEMRVTWTHVVDAGMKVDHVFPVRILAGRLSDSLEDRIREIPGVLAVHRGPLMPGQYGELDPISELAFRVFHRAFVTGGSLTPGAFDTELLGDDARQRPPRDEMEEGRAVPEPPGFYETSEFMNGTVTVGLILPESNGLSEPDTEDWTSDEVAHVASQVAMGLDFFSNFNENADLTWVYHFADAPPAGGQPGTVECDFEAIQHSMFYSTVAQSFYSYLGYTDSSWWTNTYQFINDLRNLYGTDWAFMVKCADDTSGDRTYYTNGIAAAYVAGPTTSMSYTNGGYGPDLMFGVLRHETIHIFGAIDEYTTFNGCPSQNMPSYFWGYLGVVNANSVCNNGLGYRDGAGEGRSCIGWNVSQHNEIFCPYTRGQLGWLDDDFDGLPNPIDTHPDSTLNDPTFSGSSASFTGTAEVTALLPEQGHWGDHTVPVSINTLSGVQYRIDGRTWMEADAQDLSFDSWIEDFAFSTPDLPTGTYEVEARALNNRGNSDGSTSKSSVIINASIIENTVPFAEVEVFPQMGSPATLFRLDASKSGDLQEKTDRLKVRWDFEGDGTYDTAFSSKKVVHHAYTGAGLYFPRVEVRDSQGLTATDTILVNVWFTDVSPTAAFSVNRESMHGEEIAGFVFDASDSYDAETPDSQLEFRWDWDDDGTWDTEYSSATVRSHAYPSLGTGVNTHSNAWTVRMEVRDGSDQTSTCTQWVWANGYNHEPEASFTSDKLTAIPGEIINLDASASYDPDEDEVWDDSVQYRWDYDGDGTFETDYSNLLHTVQVSFDEVGVYPVTLEVRDRYHARSRQVTHIAVSEDGLNTPPLADFTIRVVYVSTLPDPDFSTTSTPVPVPWFLVNAGPSSDAEDPGSSLQVRWDWENDGTWDTPFTTAKRDSHHYPDNKNPLIRMEVRDTGGLSDIFVQEYQDLDAPAPPVGLQVIPGPSVVSLSWLPNGENDLGGYRVYRKTPAQKDFVHLADTGVATQYDDFDVLEGMTYIYAVTAYDVGGRESFFSDEVPVTVPDLTPPEPPQNILYAVGDNIVYLRWDENTEPDFNVYFIYRRVLGETDWVALWLAWTADYTDSTAVTGTTYEYTVTALDYNNNESDFATPVVVTPRTWDTDPPAAPTGVVAETETGGIRVDWELVPEDDVFNYLVLRREQGQAEYEFAGFAFFNQTSILDSDVSAHTTYCYVVVAGDTSGNQSLYSTEDCSTAGVFQEPVDLGP